MEAMTYEEARKVCQDFANEHKLIFEDDGECGFGRKCVGLNIGGSWLNFNPYNASTYEPIEGLQCDDCYAPDGVEAYHKHDCFAVLGQGESAVIQLATWIKHMQSKGKCRVVEYQTGATGFQAMLSGVFSKCLVIDKAGA